MQTPLISDLQGTEEKQVEILTTVACGHDIRYITPEWTHNIHPPSVVSLCVCVLPPTPSPSPSGQWALMCVPVKLC